MTEQSLPPYIAGLERRLLRPGPEIIGGLVMDLLSVVRTHVDIPAAKIRLRNPNTMVFSTLQGSSIQTAAEAAAADSWIAHNDTTLAAAEVRRRLATGNQQTMTATVRTHDYTNGKYNQFGVFLADSALTAERDRSKQIAHELAGLTTRQPAKARPILWLVVKTHFNKHMMWHLNIAAKKRMPEGTPFTFGPLQPTTSSAPEWFLSSEEI